MLLVIEMDSRESWFSKKSQAFAGVTLAEGIIIEDDDNDSDNSGGKIFFRGAVN